MADPTNIKQFLKKYKANQQLVLDACAKTINNTLLEMYKKIIDRTPVGNPKLWKWPAPSDYTPGTLKASWHLSFNNRQRNTTGQFASTTQILGDHGLSFKVSNKERQEAVIFNPQPYAQRVETGWSTQAPAGMMRITIAEYTTILADETNKYKVK